MLATESCPDVTAPAYLFTPGGNAISATATDKAEFVDALGQAVARRYRTGPVANDQ